MNITPEGVVLVVACLGNIGALVYNTGAVNARLKVIEHTLNNGMSGEMKDHGERLASLEAVQEVE